MQSGFYTLKQDGANVIATHVNNNQNVTIKPDHHKFEKIKEYLRQGKLLSITQKGTVSGRKDYEGFYKKSVKTKSKSIEVKLTKLDDLNFSDDLFVPMKTGTVADKFLSNDGGFMPGSNIMAAGAPGVGKTTLLLEMLYKVIEQDPSKKVLFISAEMNRLDMARYLKRFPHWGQLPILFLSDYIESDPKQVIEDCLNQGFDLVLTDSYTEVNDTVKEECGLTRSKTEKWFLDLMISQNQGNNLLKKYTTFITILQLSKGGNFVGSNKLKHMTSAMMNLDWKGGENSNERYMEFSKNRLGQVGQKLFFSLEDGVRFDEQRYSRDLLNEVLIKEEKQKLKSEEDAFDRLFSNITSENQETIDA